MALTAMRITRGPTGAIGIGLTDTGATIEKGSSDVLPSVLVNCAFKLIIEGQASPFTGLKASARL